MVGEIDKIIKDKSLKPSDCSYHTIRTLENKGKLRVLVIKGEDTAHIEYTCPKCGNSGYKTQEWKQVSKAAKIKAKLNCDKCGLTIKVGKLKGKK